jgi:hypothetical protein
MVSLLQQWHKLPKATRLQLVATVGCAMLVAGWRWAICPAPVAEAMIRYGGYYIEALTAGLAVYFAFRALRDSWRGWAGLAPHRWGLAAILGCAVFLQVHEPHTFKVLFDEYELGAVSQNLHFQREAAMPEKMHAVDGVPTPIGGRVDKRPIAYPFLVATVHDLTGYRPANAWIVNGVLAAELLALVYASGVALAGARAGLTGVFLLTGLPLLAQNATGAGFDLLNMTVLAGAFLAAVHYLKGKDDGGLNLLVFTTVFLAGVRYESLLYLLALPVLVMIRWLREPAEARRLSWWVAGAPLLLTLPLGVQQVYFAHEEYFQTDRSNFINIAHIPNNLAHAVYFLFQWGSDQPNSLLLSAAGVVAGLLTLVVFGRIFRTALTTEKPAALVLMVFLPLVLVNTVLAMSLDWGGWDDPNISRYALPFLLALVWCVQFVIGSLAMNRLAQRWVVAIAALYVLLVSAPTMAQAHATGELRPHVLHDWAIAWLQEHGGLDTLVLARSPLPFIVYRQPAMSLGEANQHPERLWRALKLGLYRQILIVQEIVLSPETGRFEPAIVKPGSKDSPPEGESVNPILQTEVVAEARLHTRLIVRISRITGYDPDWKSKPPPPPPPQLTPAGEDQNKLHELLIQQYP